MRPHKELKLQLFVHIPNDQVISLNINSNSTIGDLKSKLELQAGILSDLQDLYVNNMKVMEKDTFSSVKVKNGSLLQLKFKEKMFRNVYLDAFNGDSKKLFKHEIEAIHGEELNVLDEVSIVLNKMASLKAFQAAFTACFKGHVALLRKIIIKNSAVVASTTKNGRSLLHVAADAGNYSCLAVLLKKGSQLCKKDNDGFTALHLATANGHSQCEKYLATHDLKFLCRDDSNLNKEKSEKFFPPIVVHTTNVNDVHEKKKLNQEQLPTLETLPSHEQLSAQQQSLTLEQLPTLEQLSTRKKFLADEKNLCSIDKPINIQNQADIKDIQCSRKKVCQLFRSRSAPHIQTFQYLENQTQLELQRKSNLTSTSYTNQDDLKGLLNNKKNEECKKISKQLFNLSKEENNTGMSEKFLSSTPLSNFNKNKAMSIQQSIFWSPDKDNTKLTIPWPHVVEKRITISKSFSHFQEYPKFVCKKLKAHNSSIKSKPSKNKKLCLKQTKVPNTQTVLSLQANFSILNRITDGKVFFLDSSFSTVVNKKNIFLNSSNKPISNIENAETYHKISIDSSASNKVSLTVTNKKDVFKVQPYKYKFEAKSHVYHKTSLTVYKLKRKEVKRMTFEEWVFLKKQLQNKNKTFETSSVANSLKAKNQKSHAVSFETWLQRKRAHEELKKQKQAELDLKKENETLLTSSSRLMDPHQRTFEEWFLEKKSQQKHQEKKVFKRTVSSAEDRELIFNLWLLDKFKAEIQTETELLMKERLLSSSMDY